MLSKVRDEAADNAEIDAREVECSLFAKGCCEEVGKLLDICSVGFCGFVAEATHGCQVAQEFIEPCCRHCCIRS